MNAMAGSARWALTVERETVPIAFDASFAPTPQGVISMKYMVAGIDVHKRMLAVVVAEAKVGEMEFERRRFQTTRSGLMELAQWLKEREVKEAVMESTAQYWRPVWLALEQTFKLQLAQARGNGARRGRKSDFRDAERMVQRLISGDLVLSFVPEEEQRGWRFLAR